MKEKLCVFCQHFDWEKFGYVHYSTLTGGDLNGGASCSKSHYYSENPDTSEDLRALILKAESCLDYLVPT